MPSGLAAAALFLLGACGGPSGPAPPSDGVPPRRVVVIGPSTAENVYLLGAGDRVVGVSDWCLEPGAAALPRVGGQADPNLERIAQLDPDLVLTQGRNPTLEAWCQRSQVGFRAFATDTWQGWEDELAELGRLFGLEDAATRRVIEGRSALDQLRAARPEARPTVLIVISRRTGAASGMLVAGGASFLSELLEAAGGRNLYAGHPRDYFDLGEEALLQQQPEYIFEFQPEETEPLEVWRRSFPRLAAVEKGRVIAFRHDFLLLPGPRMVETARLFAEALRASSG